MEIIDFCAISLLSSHPYHNQDQNRSWCSKVQNPQVLNRIQDIFSLNHLFFDCNLIGICKFAVGCLNSLFSYLKLFVCYFKSSYSFAVCLDFIGFAAEFKGYFLIFEDFTIAV